MRGIDNTPLRIRWFIDKSEVLTTGVWDMGILDKDSSDHFLLIGL